MSVVYLVMGLGWHQLHSFILQTNRPTLEATVKASRARLPRRTTTAAASSHIGADDHGRHIVVDSVVVARRQSVFFFFHPSPLHACRAYSIWPTFHVRALKECCGACSFAYLLTTIRLLWASDKRTSTGSSRKK